jgi:hypothetical protein
VIEHHLKQAVKNQQFLERLEADHPEEYYDWKITVIFYVVVHWSRAFIKVRERRAVSIASHTQAKAYLKKHFRKFAYDYYVTLDELCDTARYEGVDVAEAVWVQDRKDDYDAAKKIMEALQREIGRFIPEVLNPLPPSAHAMPTAEQNP